MNAEVGAWEPSGSLGEQHAKALDAAAREANDRAVFTGVDADLLRAVVAAVGAERASLFDHQPSARLLSWLRALTLAEQTVPGCDAGAKSPVIDLARLLRERGDYPPELTPWIKSVSNNRFLPYGSLADRLRG